MEPPPLPKSEYPPPLPRSTRPNRLLIVCACGSVAALFCFLAWAALMHGKDAKVDQLAKQLMDHADAGNYQQGLQLAEEELPKIKPNAKVYYAMEHIYYGLNDLEKTKFYAQKTLETDPSNEMAARILISICRDFDDNETAYQAGKDWVSKNPNGSDIYKDLAMAADDAGHDDEAYKFAAEAYHRKPDHPRVTSVYFYYALQNEPAATVLPQVDKWLETHKADEFFWAQIGKGLSDAREWKEAIPRLRRALDMGSHDDGVITEMLESHRMLHDVQGAETFFEKLKSTSSPSATAWRTMGAIYYDNEDYQKALDTFRQSRRVDPENATTLTNILYTLSNLGRSADAIQEGDKWFATRPTKATHQFHHALGNAHYGLCHWADAEKCYRASFKLDPSSQPTARELISVLTRLGRAEEAVQFGTGWQKQNPEARDPSFDRALSDAKKAVDQQTSTDKPPARNTSPAAISGEARQEKS